MPEPLPHLRDLQSPTLTPEQRARLVQRLRRGLAALSLVGAALVALPLAQLMRYQSAEIKALGAKRASLDPIARAVSLQRGLMAHAELAHQVLRGEEKLEADRRQRQAEVDGRLAALNVALASGHWDLAMGEAEELRNDWLQLARQVLQRQIAAAASNDSHRLLVEQTLQVIDLVTAAGRNGRGEETGQPGPAAAYAEDLPAGTAAAIRALPRLVWLTAQLLQPAEPAGSAPRLQPLEAALARLMKLIEGQSGPAGLSAAAASPVDERGSAVNSSNGSNSDGNGPAALAATARATAAASARYFALLRQGNASRQALLDAERGALQAQMRLFDQAHGQATAALAAQSRAVSQRRALMLGGLCFGVLIALGLLGALRRDLRRLASDDQQRADDAAAPPATDGQSGGRQHAERLLQRMRDAQARPQATLPAADPAATDHETRR